MKVKETFLLILFCLIAITITYGQQVELTGTVKDDSGIPIPGVNITVDGSNSGTSTDFDGNYSIQVNPGDKLTFSSVGFQDQTVEITDQNELNISLKTGSSLDEVVITALGISREKRSLGYSTQEVKGEDVNLVPSDNFIGSLSGEVAGIQIVNSTNIGGSVDVNIRGNKSLTGNNQALFVVDGVPVSNDNFNLADQTAGNGGFDLGNLASDINSDDIESVNVLKGAAATALYGSRAANGVIVVTTKTGAKERKPVVSVNSAVTMGFIDRKTWPEYQYQFGAGYGKIYGPNRDGFFNIEDVDGDGTDDLVQPATAYGSFGAPFDSNLQVFQWDAFDPDSPNYLKATPWKAPEHKLIKFFETPITFSNNVSVAGATEDATYRISYTSFRQKGILPNSHIKKDNINVNLSVKPIDKLTLSATANYVKADGVGRNRTGQETGPEAGNVISTFRKYWAMNADIIELKNIYFNTGKNIDPYMGGTIDNPYWVLYENYETDTRNRIYGNASAKYDITDWLNIEGRVSLDTYSFFVEERKNEHTVGSIGMYRRRNINFTEMNYDLMLNYNKDIGDNFNLSGVIGTNIRRNRLRSISAETNGGLVIPNLYSLSNSINPIEAPQEIDEHVGVNGFYGLFSIGYKRTLYLDLTGRFDRSSTLPAQDNTFFYPSISSSFVFSELLNSQSFLSFGKLSLNYAEVGNGAPANSLLDIYSKPTAFGSIPLYAVNNTKNNLGLKPEKSKSFEGGLEMNFLKNRLSLDLSIYQTNSVDQIIPVAVASSTGYASKFVNAGKISNNGVEVSLSGTPVKTDHFEWNIGLNWSKNKNEVKSLFEGGENLLLAAPGSGGITINATVGEAYGAIRGRDYVYVNGKPVVNQETGEYERTSASNHIIGNITPDWNAGLSNSFRYNNFNFSFLIDMQKGGDIFSRDMAVGNRSGLYMNTVGLNDLGNPIRSPIEEGGGIILDGVTPDGDVNQVRTRMDIYTHALGEVKAPDAYFVYDASYIKLREAAISYNLPLNGFLGDLKLSNARISIVGSNLWIIHKNLPYSDPEASLSAGNGLRGYQEGPLPTTRNIGFKVNLQF